MLKALKTLRGFQRVDVPAGKTSHATINLSPASFEFYDWSQNKMAITPGEYEVYYGNSSDDKDLKMTKITIL
jgi:beta-glucosidase